MFDWLSKLMARLILCQFWQTEDISTRLPIIIYLSFTFYKKIPHFLRFSI